MDILLAAIALILAIIALCLVVTADRRQPFRYLWWAMMALGGVILAGLWLLFLLIFN